MLLGVDWVWVMVVVLGERVVQPGGSAVPNVEVEVLVELVELDDMLLVVVVVEEELVARLG